MLYADNFWQELSGEVITGSSLAGAYNRKLTNLSGGYGSGHSDVHLWYHGTIDLATPATDTQATINASERTAWWTAGENGGANTGFLYSRLGGGDRLSTAAPAGGAQVRAGFNGAWDLGGGLVANRQSLSVNGGLWPNVIRCQRGDSGSIAAGGTFPLAIHYQAGATASGDVALTVLLDPDANPWNDNAFEIDAGTLAKTGPDAVSFVEIPVGTGSTPPGSYRVAARLTDGLNERILYAATTIEITAGIPAPAIQRETVRIEGGLMRFTIAGTAGQTVVVRAAENLTDWEVIASSTLVTGTWEFSDPDTASYSARFYQVEAGP